FQPQDQFVHERGGVLARIGDEDLELLACASVGHGLPGSRPESRTLGIGHMCRSSATADLIGEIRYAHGIKSFFRFAPESGQPSLAVSAGGSALADARAHKAGEG